MIMTSEGAQSIKLNLIETGGRTSQELGMGRIVGQMLVYLYLNDNHCSLDQIGADLELSKASVSIAARQLEKLGLIKRIWQKGDRKSYYRTAENIETAIGNGLISFVLQKIHTVGIEFDRASELLTKEVEKSNKDPEIAFVHSRVKRAKNLRDTVLKLVENPFLSAFFR